MADGVTVAVPRIDRAVFSPNPAAMNRAVTLTVTVSERTVTLLPERIYAGEFYAGEGSEWQ